VVEHEDLWAAVTVARAAAALPQEALGPLRLLQEHDEVGGTDYLQTLTAWLDHPGAPTAAARAIHVHPNTMRYRMGRIADLAGLDLDDPVVRLAVRLQLAGVRGGESSA
jgi:DNA-binding PucR family transcriptional regulator